jgi:hypothetical protein
VWVKRAAHVGVYFPNRVPRAAWRCLHHGNGTDVTRLASYVTLARNPNALFTYWLGQQVAKIYIKVIAHTYKALKGSFSALCTTPLSKSLRMYSILLLFRRQKNARGKIAQVSHLAADSQGNELVPMGSCCISRFCAVRGRRARTIRFLPRELFSCR